MTSLQDVEWEAPFLEPVRDSALDAEVRRELGILPPHFRMFYPCPWLTRLLWLGDYKRGALVDLPGELADLAFLAVSQESSCRFCYAAQHAQLRILGMDEARIRRIEEASVVAEDDPVERMALDYARRISRANPVPGSADREVLREAGFSDHAIRELTFVAASTVAANRVTTLSALPLEGVEGLDERWWVRLLRPLVASRLRRSRSQGKPEWLSDDAKRLPYAYVALPFDGLPVARLLSQVTESAWSSEILPVRTKGLIYAVVARGLGSRRAEAEAARLIAPHDLDEGQLDEVLSNLGSPKLDALEAEAVPFARASIRYRPDEIQRRARELRARLSAAQFLEVVGLAAIANSAARLSLAFCEE